MVKAIEKAQQASKLLANAEQLIKALEELDVRQELTQLESLIERFNQAKKLLEQREDELLEILFRCELIIGTRDFTIGTNRTYRVVETDMVIRRPSGNEPEAKFTRKEFREDTGDLRHIAIDVLYSRIVGFVENSAKYIPRRLSTIRSVIASLNLAQGKA